MADKYYIGVDVGTASVRAGLVDSRGTLVTTATQPIKIVEPQPDFYEQSTEDIWQSCCSVVKVSRREKDIL